MRLTDIDPLFLISLLNNPFLLSAYLDHFDLGSRMSVYYTTDASANPTSSYHYFRFQVDASGNVLVKTTEGTAIELLKKLKRAKAKLN